MLVKTIAQPDTVPTLNPQHVVTPALGPPDWHVEVSAARMDLYDHDGWRGWGGSFGYLVTPHLMRPLVACLDETKPRSAIVTM